MFRDEALERGRFKRDPNRWQTDFGRWVADVGVLRIVAHPQRVCSSIFPATHPLTAG